MPAGNTPFVRAGPRFSISLEFWCRVSPSELQNTALAVSFGVMPRGVEANDEASLTVSCVARQRNKETAHEGAAGQANDDKDRNAPEDLWLPNADSIAVGHA